jgi:hypothetical protein
MSSEQSKSSSEVTYSQTVRGHHRSRSLVDTSAYEADAPEAETKPSDDSEGKLSNLVPLATRQDTPRPSIVRELTYDTQSQNRTHSEPPAEPSEANREYTELLPPTKSKTTIPEATNLSQKGKH